jgi:hypothetical protein
MLTLVTEDNVTLRDFILSILEERQRAFDVRKDQAQLYVEAIEKKLEAYNKRLTATEILIANWSGRLRIIGILWSVVTLLLGALISYVLRRL